MKVKEARKGMEEERMVMAVPAKAEHSPVWFLVRTKECQHVICSNNN
jgi:hypothetical protein